jgi:hypothetical protein
LTIVSSLALIRGSRSFANSKRIALPVRYGIHDGQTGHSRNVLVLYRERSGEKNFVSGGIGRPERFRYSDLKEAVVECSSYVF